MSADAIAISLGSGAFSLLLIFFFFGMKDLYRRLRDVEQFKEETAIKLKAMELMLASNSKTLETMAIDIREIALNCLKRRLGNGCQDQTKPSLHDN